MLSIKLTSISNPGRNILYRSSSYRSRARTGIPTSDHRIRKRATIFFNTVAQQK